MIPLPLPSQNGKISEINVKMPLFQFYTFLEQQLSGVHFFFTYRSLLSIKNIGDCDWPTKFDIYIHFILRNVKFLFFYPSEWKWNVFFFCTGSKHRLSGRIVFFSGKSGKVLSWSGVPDEKESYYSPQVLTKSDGTKLVLFGTGGETHGGGLWLLSVNDLFYHRLENVREIQ